MDLIGELSSKLGMNPDKAQGLAGAVLGMVNQEIGDKLGEGAQQQLQANVPELGSWQEAAKAYTGEQQGGILGAAAGLLGSDSGFDLGSLMKLASNFNLDGNTAKSLAPIVLQFLESRLDGELLDKIKGAIPALGGAGGGGGGLAGALGGLL